MAKKSHEIGSNSDKAKVRVFFAELEGNNDSVQEALRTMVSAMGRPVRIVSEQRVGSKTTTLLEDSTVEEDDESLVEENETGETFDNSDGPATRAPRGSGKKVDRNAGLQLVPNLNFRIEGETPFKQFATEKNTKNDQELVLVALYYMQHIMTLPKIGPSHLLTAFKDVNKPIPSDLRQTIRNAKNKRIWLNYSDIEDIKTTTQGDNAVLHEIGKSE